LSWVASHSDPLLRRAQLRLGGVDLPLRVDIAVARALAPRAPSTRVW
jgi:hypothetical protein